MEDINNQSSSQGFQETESSNFDILEWLGKLLHYWYLFIIGIALASGAAYLKNRSWLPSYLTSGTIIIQEYGRVSGGTQALMQGFGVDAGYKNVNNQVIMLSSYDLMCKVVDSLPFMSVDYITMGRFKKRNIYNETPFVIEHERVDPSAYGVLFSIELKQDGTFEIGIDKQDNFVLHGRYGQPLHHDLFDITVFPTEKMSTGKMYFRFRDRESLVADFSSRLQLNFVSSGSSVLSISLVSETPDRDKDFINKLCNMYLGANLNRKNDVANNTINFINQQLDLLSKSLVVSESEMTKFRQANKIVDVSSYAGTLMSKMEEYDNQSLTLRLKGTYLDYLTNYLTTNMEAGAIVAPSSLGLNEPMLMTLVQQLNDLHLQRNEVTEQNIYYAKYTKDIDNVKTAIMEVVKSMQASLTIEKNDLAARYADVEKNIEKLPQKELEMVAIERNYRIDDNYYTFFLQKRAEAEIQKASNTPDNDILDKARTLSITNGGAKRKNLMTMLVIGLLLPAAFVVAKELLNNTIRTSKDIEKITKYTILGTVRHVRSQNPTLVLKNPRSSYAEMLRAIRMRIEFIVQRKTHITMLITSAQSGDGKTFITTNIAALYAMSNKKVVVVDMDIRKPNVHEKLNLSASKGITNYLIGEVSLEDIIHKDMYDFDVIQAGTIPPNPGELIRSEKLNELFKILRERYDFVLIDTSPIGLVSDAYALMNISDVNLFIIRAEKTNKAFCKNVLTQLSNDKKENVYLILSDMNVDNANYFYSNKSYSYGGSYGYGYGYGSKHKEGFSHYYHDDEDI